MKVTFLGQAGLLFESNKMKVMLDPYLSDSVGAVDESKHRRVPVEEAFFAATPDVLIFTHSHLDHYDPETVERILNTEKPITVLAPSSVWGTVRQYGGKHNYVLFDRHTVWTQEPFRFTAVKAQHSDVHAIGVVLEAEGKTYYAAGDTLYSKEIFPDLPKGIDVAFLPVNGVGNNMNMSDAAAFAKKIRAKTVVPLHIGLFDHLRGEDFPMKNKVVAEIYKEILL